MLSVDNPYGMLGRIVRAEVPSGYPILYTGGVLRDIKSKLDDIERTMADMKPEDPYITLLPHSHPHQVEEPAYSADSVEMYWTTSEASNNIFENLKLKTTYGFGVMSSGGNGGEIDPNNMPGSNPPVDEDDTTCPTHPNRQLEWDGYCMVCPSCILDNYEDTSTHPIDCTCIYCIPGN